MPLGRSATCHLGPSALQSERDDSVGVLPASARGVALALLLLSFLSEPVTLSEDTAVRAAIHVVLACSVFRAGLAACLAVPLMVFTVAGDEAGRLLVPLVAVATLLSVTRRRAHAAVFLVVVTCWLLAATMVGPLVRQAALGAYLPLLYGCAAGGMLIRRLVLQRRAVADALARSERDLAEAQATERARLAGELHDLVAHDVTTLVMVSAMGRTLDDPERMRELFTRMEQTSRSAVADLRRLFGVLESSGSAVSTGPSMDRPDVSAVLDEHVGDLRRLGFSVTVNRSGDLGDLTASMRHTLRRAITEMFTNVAKHAAPGTEVGVLLQVTPSAILVRIVNGVGPRLPSSRSGGMGLRNIGQQVGLFDGAFESRMHGDRWVAEIRLPRPSGVPEVDHRQ